MSDRATALIKLGSVDYLNVCSMPDLFHFNQTLARQIGSVIGRAAWRAWTDFQQIKATGAYYSQRRPHEDRYYWQENCRRSYQDAMHTIHKTLHAFDFTGNWQQSENIECGLTQAVIQAEQQLLKSKVVTSKTNIWEADLTQNNVEHSLAQKHKDKLFKQIPDLIEGIQTWQRWAITRIELFSESLGKNLLDSMTIELSSLQKYLTHYFIPCYYWQLVYQRTPAKKRNQRLRRFYRSQLEECTAQLEEHPLSSLIPSEELTRCTEWAKRLVRTFQRASSAVEGRNGYLSFVHRANRGMSNQRLEVLTVVHNYDIRSWDDQTPAERLFQRDFPDLFEFVLHNVTGFPEPRAKRRKPNVHAGVAP